MANRTLIEREPDKEIDAIDIKEELIEVEDEEDFVDNEHELCVEEVPAVSNSENATYFVFLVEEESTYSKLTSLLVLNPSEEERRLSLDVCDSFKSREKEAPCAQSSPVSSVTQGASVRAKALP